MKKKACNKEEFTKTVNQTMRAMGLKILESGVDYDTFKPDLVAIYEDKKKYYVIETVSEGCLLQPSPRLCSGDIFEEYRAYCKKLFPDNHSHAALAATIICDLVSGLDLFQYKSIGTYHLTFMVRYAALAIPQEFVGDASLVLEKLNIDYGKLDILDKFTLILISKEFTEKLSETRKFIQFILSNK